MIKKIIYIACSAFLLVACDNSSSDSSGDSSNSSGSIARKLYNVQVKCFETNTITAECANGGTANGKTARVAWSTDSCANWPTNRNISSLGTVTINCTAANPPCTGTVTSYSKSTLDEGSYTIVTFIDIDGDEVPDDTDPYVCGSDYQVSQGNENITQDIEITKDFVNRD